ncbi:MAG: alpha/beta fold hydrolase [Thermoanaerobacterales bacterium]|nr:alpha/beta fold hydrolase [Thermoanaerobacterales bacterium]
MPRDTRPLTLRTADGLSLAADAWLTPTAASSAVVLVHGFTAHRRDPSVVAAAHELRDAGHAVLTYDMRGHGESDGLCTLGDREALDVAAAAVAARDLAPRVVLVGASLGAIAVLRYAVDDPDLAGVVTVSAPARWRLHSPRAALAAVLTRTGPGRRLARRLGARLDRRWRWTEPPDALAARLPVPLAVVHGGADRFMPAAEADRLHRAGTATAGGRAHGAPRRLLVVPDMGHAYCTRGLDAVADAVGWCLAAAPQGRPA